LNFEEAKKLDYVSTRGQAPSLGFEDVLLVGLARDGGLYLPKIWPQLTHEEIAGFAGKPFHEVAAHVIGLFTGSSVSHDELLKMAREAYGTFSHAAVTPLVQIDNNRFILELFHGPTMAFKDVAMQLLARLMDNALMKRKRCATIVGATSGDTGGAAIEAFRGSKRADVFILFPDHRVSDVQRRMMTTPREKNVHAVAIRGNFDDCQALVKAMFNHHAFADRLQLSGVNSINWARIVAQVTYYFVAAVALGGPYRKVSFCVPTGNFGDIFAGYVASKMGLPIHKLVIGSNTNDILPRALTTGVYEMSGVVTTSSPSMDIQISSNFERYLFESSSRDGARVREQMGALAQSGRFELGKSWNAMKEDFSAASASEQNVADITRQVFEQSGYRLDPHTACGVYAAHKTLRPDGATPQVVLSTAHPAKFPDAMEKVLGQRPALPKRLSHLMDDKEHFPVLDNDQAVVESYIEEHARALGQELR